MKILKVCSSLLFCTLCFFLVENSYLNLFGQSSGSCGWYGLPAAAYWGILLLSASSVCSQVCSCYCSRCEDFLVMRSHTTTLRLLLSRNFCPHLRFHSLGCRQLRVLSTVKALVSFFLFESPKKPAWAQALNFINQISHLNFFFD